MSIPRYPAYKDGNTEWLGEVPVHCSGIRLDAVLGTHRNTLSPEDLAGKTVFHYSIPVVQTCGDGQLEDGSEIDSNKLLIEEPQVLVSKLNPRKGTVCIAQPHDATTVGSTEFVPLLPRLTDIRFTWYLVQAESYRARLESLVESATKSHQRTTPSDIRKAKWALPPREEQLTIAAFLDRETAKIDALIAEQQRLIELLQEKRQAVISHAVTKGLNPNAPMKDSGVEWLGEVPEHWEVIRLKYLTQDIDGVQMGPFGALLIDLESQDTGYKVYGQENVIKQDLELGSRWISKARFQELERYTLGIGDIAVTRKGSLGNALLIQSMPQPGIGDSDTIRIRCAEERLHPSFLVRLLHEADYINQQLIQLKRGSVLPGLNTETIRGLVVAVPQLHEQEELLSSINEICEEIYRLASQATATESLLKERRSALISAAVTGQIDVRGLVEAEAGEQ